MSFEKVEITQFAPYVQKEIKQAKLNPNDDKYIDDTEIGNVLKHFNKKDVKELYAKKESFWSSMYLDLYKTPKNEVIPPRLTPEMQAEYERKNRVAVVELGNLDKSIRNKVKNYDNNNDGILSNNATPDKSDKELEDIYKERKIDLTKYETEDVIKTEKECIYKEPNYNNKPLIKLYKTTLTYTDGHETTISEDANYVTRHSSYYPYEPYEVLHKDIIRTEYFNDGFRQTTWMDEDYSISDIEKKMKIEENVSYKEESGFTRKTMLNNDGTSYILYTRGWCQWSDEFGDDDPNGFGKSRDFKEVLIKIDDKGNIVEEIENTAQCGEEYMSFQKKYR